MRHSVQQVTPSLESTFVNTSGVGQNGKMKEAGKKREERMKNFLEEVSHLTNRLLEDEEWLQFATMVDTLVVDLNNLIVRKPGGHPTTNWKKRPRK